MDKELVSLLVAHGVCDTQKEANSRVDKMSAATKIDMLKVLRDKSKYSLLNDSLEEARGAEEVDLSPVDVLRAHLNFEGNEDGSISIWAIDADEESAIKIEGLSEEEFESLKEVFHDVEEEFEDEGLKEKIEQQPDTIYKGITIEHFPMEWHYADKTWDQDGYVILSPYYLQSTSEKPKTYLPLFCEDEFGEVLNFKTLDDAKNYIDNYIVPKKGKIKIKAPYGGSDEAHFELLPEYRKHKEDDDKSEDEVGETLDEEEKLEESLKEARGAGKGQKLDKFFRLVGNLHKDNLSKEEIARLEKARAEVERFEPTSEYEKKDKKNLLQQIERVLKDGKLEEARGPGRGQKLDKAKTTKVAKGNSNPSKATKIKTDDMEYLTREQRIAFDKFMQDAYIRNKRDFDKALDEIIDSEWHDYFEIGVLTMIFENFIDERKLDDNNGLDESTITEDNLKESTSSGLSQIDLDWSSDIKDTKKLASKFNLTMEVLKLHGPAGNNPVLRFKGLKQDIIDFLRNVNYAHDSEELESIIAEIVNENLLKEYLYKYTVGQLRTRLEAALEKLEDHDDDEKVNFASNTYWVGPHFISIPGLGFIDLEDIFGDEENLDEERITEVAGGESNGMTVEDIAKKHGVTPEEIESQLKVGIEIEQEHTSDLEAAKKIAMDHLVEFADYYDRLVEMEKEAESEIDNITDVTDESEPLKEEYYYNDKQENDFQLLVSDIWSKYSNTHRKTICDLVYNVKQDLGLKETDVDRDKLRKIVEQSLVDGSYNDYLDTGSLSYLQEINESEEKLIKYAIDMIHWEPVTYLPEWAQIVDDNEYPIIVKAPENASLEDIKDELIKLGAHENVNADIEGDFEFDYEDIDYRVADESETNIEESLTESTDNLVKELKNNKLFKDFVDTEISKVIRIYAKDSGVKVIDIKAEDVVNFIEDIGGWGAFVLEFLTLDKSGITQEMVVKMVKKDPKLLKLVKKFADENHLLDEVERGDGIEKTDDNYIITALSFNLGGKKSTVKKDRAYTIKELNKEYIALKEDFNDDDDDEDSSFEDDINYSYSVYELDEEGDEVDSLESFNTLEEAIAFAKKQSFSTHIVYVPDQDPDDYGYPETPDGYEAFEVVWSSDDKDDKSDLDEADLFEADEEIINDDSIQVYQFPNSVEEYLDLAEFKKLCFNHDIKFLGKGKNVIDETEEPDFFVEGRYADLTAMAEDMDYELNPDYLCPAESFAREDILIEEVEEEIETHNEENIVDESFDSGLSFEEMFWGIYDGEFDLPFEETIDYIHNNYAEKIWVNEEASADLSVLTETEEKDIIEHAKEEAQNWSNLDIYNSHARYKNIPTIKKQIEELFGVTNDKLHETLENNEGVELDDEGNFYETPDLNEFAFIIWSDEYDNEDFDKIKKFLDENDITTNFDDKNLIVIPENKEESDKISAFLDTIYGGLPEDDSSVDTL